MTRKTIVSHAEQIRLREREDAHLLLVKPCRTSFDFEVIRFNSRAALEAFNRKANLSAVVKTQVPLNCAIYRHESDSEARAKAQARTNPLGNRTMKTKNHFGNQEILPMEPVIGFGGNASVVESTGPCTAQVKVVGFSPVECYLQRNSAGRLCAVRRVLISDIVYIT